MQRLLLCTSAAALISSVAFAADLTEMDPASILVPVPAAHDWSGFYAGLSGGWVWTGDDDAAIDCDLLGIVCASAGGPFPDLIGLGDGDGGIIGGTVGFSWQANRIVFGLEGDVSWTGIDADGRFSFPGGGNVDPIELRVDREVEWFGTARGRLGVAADRFLIFGTGGLAFADVELSTLAVDPTPGALENFSGAEDDWEFGWTLGGGVEVAVTNRFSVKAEALYFDLGDQSATATDADFPGASYSVNGDNLTGVVARVGGNFHF
jgi:outer membrane immunogenic protein